MLWPYGVLFAGLGVAQLGTAVAVLFRPARRRVLLAAAAALCVVVLWALARLAEVLPTPDSWVPVNSVVGFTDYVCAGLQAVAAVVLAAVAALGPRPRQSLPRRVLAALALPPLVALVLVGVAVGVLASSNGLAGAGFPADTVPPQKVPAGRMSTVEYCRPDGVPLAMDLYMPPNHLAARSGRPAPVAMYVHGGGLWGDRKMHGFGARQANHEGALFTALQEQLNAHGFVVASIVDRLPAAPRHALAGADRGRQVRGALPAPPRARVGHRSYPDRGMGKQRRGAPLVPARPHGPRSRIRPRPVPRPVQRRPGRGRHVRTRRPQRLR